MIYPSNAIRTLLTHKPRLRYLDHAPSLSFVPVNQDQARSLKNPSRTLERTHPVNTRSVWDYWIIRASKNGSTWNLIGKHSVST